MREFTMVFDDGLRSGLQPDPDASMKSQWLSRADGVIPEDGILQTIPQLPTAITALGEDFPFPQIFELTKLTLVCGKRALYEYTPQGTLDLLCVASEAGATWSVADFEEFVTLTNGAVIVYRRPEDGVWTEYYNCDVPHCLCMLELNGQLIVGGPGIQIQEGFTGE